MSIWLDTIFLSPPTHHRIQFYRLLNHTVCVCVSAIDIEHLSHHQSVCPPIGASYQGELSTAPKWHYREITTVWFFVTFFLCVMASSFISNVSKPINVYPLERIMAVWCILVLVCQSSMCLIISTFVSVCVCVCECAIGHANQMWFLSLNYARQQQQQQPSKLPFDLFVNKPTLSRKWTKLSFDV